MLAELEDDECCCVFAQGDNSSHDGPGWYYWDADYPEDGSCGAFVTLAEAIEHASDVYTHGRFEKGDVVPLGKLHVKR